MIKLLELHHLPIHEQLKIEEDLLHNNRENWCITNTGSTRAIVMGLSAQPTAVVDIEKAQQDGIPLITRFTGGGTVIVDENTLFVTFIFERDAHPFAPFQKPILEWTSSFYKSALSLPGFTLQENDYVLGDKKIGGNAQYLKKHRWLHHTSFLYDYNEDNMSYLLHPPKEPAYRNKRSHQEFLTTIKPHMTRVEFFNRIHSAIY